MIRKQGIPLNYQRLRCIACVYMALPLLVFFCGYLKWYYSLISSVALICTFWKVIHTKNIESARNDILYVRISHLIYISFFVLIWTFLGGMSGFFYQSSDWNCRNAIYHDLITLRWPIVYESTGAALSYYIGHWMVPALLSKGILLLSGSASFAWFVGKIIFWLWTCAGLIIVILMILQYLKATSMKKWMGAILVFACFSGMDVIGAICKGNLGWLLSPDVIHLEWWSKYQFSAITTCIYWVFNQTVIPWMITLCFLEEKDSCNYIFYCVACLFCGPFPCIGLAICMAVKAIWAVAFNSIEMPQNEIIRTWFSPANLLAFVGMFPFIAAFILTNNAVTAGSGENTLQTLPAFFSLEYWDYELILFLVLEVGCYILVVFWDHKKDAVFYGLILVFIISPYFRIGSSNDFCMRVSVPAVFILMLYVSEYLQQHFAWKKIWHPTQCRNRQLCTLGLVLCLVIGSATPAVEILRGIYHVWEEGTFLLEDMSIGSFDKGTIYLNFNCTNPEKTFFFKYFAR